MKNLAGARVLITGGARGIGLAFGERFAREGAHILIADVDESVLPQAAERVRAAGGEAHTFVVDVTRPDTIAALHGAVEREGGPVDILINNAGVVSGGPFLEVPMARHRLTYEVNVMGLIEVTRAFLPGMMERPEAHLVNLASASGFIGLPYGSTYASSKWAVIGFSESIRLELETLGRGSVGVTTVCPSYVSTGMFDGVRPPRTTRMVTPERLAELTLRAVRRRRPFVLTPWLVRLTPMLKGALPTWVFDRVSWLFGSTTSMQSWRGRETAGRGGDA